MYEKRTASIQKSKVCLMAYKIRQRSFQSLLFHEVYITVLLGLYVLHH